MNKAIKVLKLNVMICLVLSWFCIMLLCFSIKDTDIQALAFIVAFVGLQDFFTKFIYQDNKIVD